MRASVKLKRKFKAYFIRLKLHKLLGPFASGLIFLGYMVRLSKWVDRQNLSYDDFYNPRVAHKDRLKMYTHLLEKYDLEGPLNYIEFGVGRGNSLRWWSENNQNPETRFYAFDTYTGLPDDWGGLEKGTFSLGGEFPDIQDDRIEFVKGLFQDTVPEVFPRVDFSRRSYWHMDADMFTSTHYALAMGSPYMKSGDIVVFDEFGVPTHEFRAFEDFTKSFPIKLEPVAAINNYLQVAFRVV